MYMYTVEIAAYIRACIYNEGNSSVMKIMNVLGIGVGVHTRDLAQMIDNARIEQGESSLKEIVKQQRIAKRRILIEKKRFLKKRKAFYTGLA